MNISALFKSVFPLIALVLSGCNPETRVEGERGIDISPEYLQYWNYNGKPVLLLGGSDEDNLFQMKDVEEQLDLLVSVGGNYVRNTMSSRDSGNVWPFDMDPTSGLYDLRKWNNTYWQRLENFLQLASEREIIVQVEIWATFDFYRENWDVNPFNPKNNINYDEIRSKLPIKVSTHPTRCDNPFFWSVPTQHNNMPVLAFQQRFVDQLLSTTLKMGNVLYCIDNETSVTSEWGKFWSTYIRKKAGELGKKIHVTEMWDPWDLDHISHRESFDHPEIYSFVEISQNNHQRGQNQWDNGLKQIDRLRKAGNLRPVNNVKTYGATGGRHGGGTHNGIESFVRSAMFGSAAVRFHRPTSGLGLSDTAQRVIHAMRMASQRIDYFRAVPQNELLLDREENEAYCRAVEGEAYLVYFPDKGEIKLETGGSGKKFQVSRQDMLSGIWSQEESTSQTGSIELSSTKRHILYVVQMQ